MSRGKGLWYPHPGKLARRRVLGFEGVIGTPLGAADLTTCPVFDQGPTGTCHAHSAAGAIWTAFQAAGKGLTFIPSPLHIASCTYADMQGPASSRGPLQDTGADLSDDSLACSTWGIAPLHASVEGRYSDVPSGAPFPEPDLSQVVIAGPELIAGEYAIPVDGNIATRCALSLDAKVPLWIGFYCDSAFEQLGPRDVAGAPNMTDPNGGGHAVYLSGYRTSGASLEFKLVNSWGASWANAGTVWVSEAWLRACWTVWPMAVAT